MRHDAARHHRWTGRLARWGAVVFAALLVVPSRALAFAGHGSSHFSRPSSGGGFGSRTRGFGGGHHFFFFGGGGGGGGVLLLLILLVVVFLIASRRRARR